MREAVVERVPEVANTAGFGAGHAEAVLVGSEIPIALMSVNARSGEM